MSKDGKSIPGKFKCMCQPMDMGREILEAVPTFEQINKFGNSSTPPLPHSEFLGFKISDKVYILKYLDTMSTTQLENLEKIPKFFESGAPDAPGDWSVNMTPSSFIKFCMSGMLELKASAFTYIKMIPDLWKYSDLLDRMELSAKNLLIKVKGGFIQWLNYDKDGDRSFVSELLAVIKRGNPKDENNNISIKAGTILDKEKGILDIVINVTDNNKVTKHTLYLGADKVTVTTEFPDNALKYSREITPTKVLDMAIIKDKHSVGTSFEASGFKNEIKIDSNTAVISVTADKTEIKSAKSLSVNSDKDVTVKAPAVTITGGTLTTNGTAQPTGNGAFNAIPVCPFTGAPHIGNKISGT